MGRINSDKTGEIHHTNLCQTVSKKQFGGFSTIAEQQDDLNKTLKRFSDLDPTDITPSTPVMTPR